MIMARVAVLVLHLRRTIVRLETWGLCFDQVIFWRGEWLAAKAGESETAPRRVVLRRRCQTAN